MEKELKTEITKYIEAINGTRVLKIIKIFIKGLLN